MTGYIILIALLLIAVTIIIILVKLKPGPGLGDGQKKIDILNTEIKILTDINQALRAMRGRAHHVCAVPFPPRRLDMPHSRRRCVFP